MKKIILIITILLLLQFPFAQQTSSFTKEPPSSFTQHINNGNKALKNRNYKEAFRQYWAADASTTDPRLKDEVKKKIEDLLNLLEKLKEDAEKAIEAIKKANEAERRIEETKAEADNNLIIGSYYILQNFKIQDIEYNGIMSVFSRKILEQNKRNDKQASLSFSGTERQNTKNERNDSLQIIKIEKDFKEFAIEFAEEHLDKWIWKKKRLGVNRALRYYHRENYERALKEFRTKERDSILLMDYAYIALCYMKLDESGYYYRNTYNDSAVAYWSKFIERSPDNSWAYENVVPLCDKRTSEIGILYAKKWLELSPQNPIIYEQLNRLYRSEKKYNEALIYAKKWVEIDSINIYARENYAALYYLQNNITEARQVIDSWVETNADSSKEKLYYSYYSGAPYRLVINLCSEYNDTEYALKYAQKWVEVESGNFTAYRLLANQYYKINDIANARKTIDDWAEVNIDSNEENSYNYYYISPYESIINLCSERNDIEYALSYAQKWVEIESDNFTAYQLLANQYYKINDIANARKTIDDWAEVNMDSNKGNSYYSYYYISPYESIINLCSEYNDIEYALSYAQKWLKKDTDNMKTYQLLAGVYYQKDDTINAREMIGKWSASEPILYYYGDFYIYPYKEIIKLCLKYRDLSTALLYGNTWLNKEPEDITVYQTLAEIYYQLRDIINARKAIEEWYSIDPSYSDISHFCFQQKDYSEASKYARKWIESEPEESNAYLYASVNYLLNKDFLNASRYAQKWIEKEPEESFAYKCNAMALYGLNDTVNAREVIRRWSKVKPKYSYYDDYYVKSYEEIVKLCFENNDWTTAALYGEMWIEEEPKNSSVYSYVATSYYNLNDTINASKKFRKYIELAPEEGYDDASWIYYERGDYITALQYVNEWIEEIPEDNVAYGRKAFIYIKLNENNEAKQDFMNAYQIANTKLTFNSDDKLTWRRLGSYCLFLEKYDESITALQQAEILDIDSEDVYLVVYLALSYILNEHWEKAEEKIKIWNDKHIKETFFDIMQDLKSFGIFHPDFEKALKLIDMFSNK